MDYDYIGSLREAIQAQSKHHEPWATGVHELADSEKPLFFTCKDGSARYTHLLWRPRPPES